ncbi:hypothetical protein RI543_003632 [Arxiozyma heterogenica]|uniref:Carboxyltransferase domain-containing protein n=1 Tax=Arxiozyma heterogenica TaxID=278026 RepID=A0AAN8A6N2_9SACH|nr:hypothetical protein RI543_003632 [Kazachstania heterogenica]
MSQGVRSVLIEFDGYKISQATLVKTLLFYENEICFDSNWVVPSKVFKLPMAFEENKTLACVTRYQGTIRSSAPWLSSNVDFITNVNNISRQNIYNMMYSARFLTLGLGDVFLGSLCAVPLDPRQRLLGSKYNPSRTYTERGAIGLEGMYMCIYATSSPGGYQLEGRTIPIWDKLSLSNFNKKYPWMLTPFDQIQFYPVLENELETLTEEAEAGIFVVDVDEGTFDHGLYQQWLKENEGSINAFYEKQAGERKDNFIKLVQNLNKDLSTQQNSWHEPDSDEYPENVTLIYSEYFGRF